MTKPDDGGPALDREKIARDIASAVARQWRCQDAQDCFSTQHCACIVTGLAALAVAEQAIRADERERCAEIGRSAAFRAIRGDGNASQSADQVAAAIRNQKGDAP